MSRAIPSALRKQGSCGTDAATVTFTIKGANDNPDAQDDSYVATIDNAEISDNIIDPNDSDPDGDALTVDAVEAVLAEAVKDELDTMVGMFGQSVVLVGYGMTMEFMAMCPCVEEGGCCEACLSAYPSCFA